VQPDWIQPPYSVTDLIAALLWILAAIYVSLHWRDREPGAGWFAAAMVLFALFIGNNERLELPRSRGRMRAWFSSWIDDLGCRLIPGRRGA
jgi:hypothetical protein